LVENQFKLVGRLREKEIEKEQILIKSLTDKFTV